MFLGIDEKYETLSIHDELDHRTTVSCILIKIRYNFKFSESSWKPVNRASNRPILHMVDSPQFQDSGPYSTEDRGNYPTYKLDRNSVVDTSIRWERYSYPTHKQPPLSSGMKPPPPPPPPPMPKSQPNQIKIMGTRL